MFRDRKTLAAGAVIATGLAGTVIDPNGAIGVVLFAAAAAALLYLIARSVVRLAVPSPTPDALPAFSPTRVPLVVRWRTVGVIAVASGAMLGATNLFDENGDAVLDRVLNDVTFLGGFALVAAVAAVAIGTGVRWARTAWRI